LPVSDLAAALEQLKEKVPALLDELRLAHGDVRVLGTPRRLAVFVRDLAPRQPDREELVKGPPAERAFGPDGVPTPAATGFSKSKGLAPKDLEIREMDGGKYACAVVKQAGRPAAEVLADALPGLVARIAFTKSMRWLPASRAAGNASNVAFSRPLRWFVALLGKDVLPFEYAGLVAGRTTRGLRPHGSPAIEIAAADGYFEAIQKQGIVLDPQERRALIAARARELAVSVKGEAFLPPELVAEVADLVEKPAPLLAGFDPKYLALPEDVLIAVMKKHQRYFPIRKVGADGHPPLLPHFIVVRNGDEQGLDLVRQGNEHVVAARFADADFFVREDLKHKLEDFRPRLEALTFQKKLGSMLAKNERIEKLTEALIPLLGLEADEAVFARRAATLAKADLATKMVIEMTSLQGIMGREYALRSGENAAVAEAIGSQYQPVPQTKPGLAVALADRLDSLTGLFAAGLAPSGTKDPFALRRAAIGVVQALIEHDLDFDLRLAVARAAALQPIEADAATQAAVLDFIAGRLGYLLKESFRYDVVDAVLAAQSDTPAGAKRAVEQLTAWVGREDWNAILPGYARCVRITRDQKEKFVVRRDLFVEEAEKNLYDALLNVGGPQAEGGRPRRTVDEFLEAVVQMIPAIRVFFDRVLVMAGEKALRENRLGLLQQISALAEGVADLSKLEGF